MVTPPSCRPGAPSTPSTSTLANTYGRFPSVTIPALAAKGIPDTGTENYGGPVLTAGGVLFIGATVFDHQLRAFDARTGKLLWQGNLPFAGNATPCTYMIDGKQYVLIATSGARDSERSARCGLRRLRTPLTPHHSRTTHPICTCGNVTTRPSSTRSIVTPRSVG